MHIAGLQKLTLLDFPGHIACTVFLSGCNLRCPFCHNALLVTRLAENPESHTEEEILAFLATRRRLLDGVVLTGGEPLLQEGVEDFLRAVREMGFAVKLDTNGCYPERLAGILEAGLADYVAMDIKNCLPKYPMTVGLRDFDTTPIQESVALLRSSGVDFEFRTTVMRPYHTPADIEAIAHWLEGSPKYFLQTFVDSGNLIGGGMIPFTPEEMQGLADLARPYFGMVGVRGS